MLCRAPLANYVPFPCRQADVRRGRLPRATQTRKGLHTFTGRARLPRAGRLLYCFGAVQERMVRQTKTSSTTPFRNKRPARGGWLNRPYDDAKSGALPRPTRKALSRKCRPGNRRHLSPSRLAKAGAMTFAPGPREINIPNPQAIAERPWCCSRLRRFMSCADKSRPSNLGIGRRSSRLDRRP